MERTNSPDIHYWPTLGRLFVAFVVTVFVTSLLGFMLVGGPGILIEIFSADDPMTQLRFLPRVLMPFLFELPVTAVILILSTIVARLSKLRSIFSFSLMTAALGGVVGYAIARMNSAGVSALHQSYGYPAQDHSLDDLISGGVSTLNFLIVGAIFHFVAFRRPRLQEAA